MVVPMAAPVAAQTQPAATTAPIVTRRDLADAYLTVDDIATQLGLPDARRAEWNLAFDRTTLAFFGGDFTRVIRDMHELAAQMSGDSAAGSPTRQTLALRIEALPRVLTPADSGVSIVATLLYADAARPAPYVVELAGVRDGEMDVMIFDSLTIPAAAVPGQRLSHFIPRARIGDAEGGLHFYARVPRSRVERTFRFAVLPRSADSLRAQWLRELDALPAPADAQAAATLRARLGLLTDTPDPDNSAQFLANTAELVTSLREELAAVRDGRNPYLGRRGDIWRVVQGARSTIPMRVYVPELGPVDSLPVIIALHGAGADENMFFEGYGHGVLRNFAASRRFIAVSPATVAFAGDPAALDSTLATLEREHGIDRRRVYVLGHSMGGAATLRLASARRDAVRAAVVIAGAGSLPPDAALAPTLFIGAETDLVIPVTRVQATYDTLRSRSLSVSYEMAAGWGHTLIVGAQLSRAVHWLLER